MRLVTRCLWDLDDASREAVLGVCLSVDLLRQIADSTAGRAHAVTEQRQLTARGRERRSHS